ncbi:phosphate ABC transporter substrate-binding protein [Vibrio makurazakiensis]|uniref:phosphate ABC transporter substrate-binding protein n=1 Tax=Vibrio makurazakiensis TaxID=2910250 RepID=UPI003D0A9A8C
MKGIMTAALGILFSLNVIAAPVVIGSPDLPDGLSASDVKKVYLGKKSKYNGGDFSVLELPTSDPIKADFHSAATNKSLSQLEAYWSKKLFTGKGTPPPEASQKEVIEQVASGSQLIGYVDESLVDGSVKVLLKL